MYTPTVRPISTLPSAHEPVRRRSCGHYRHAGSCPHCQRTQLARWARQLAEVTPRQAGVVVPLRANVPVQDQAPQCHGEDPGLRAMRDSGADGTI
jgi:hypothetical protein